MEKRIIDRVSRAARALGLPTPEDARTHLTCNAKGRKWKKRNPEALQGLVWHQELGWGTVEAVARYHTGSQSHLHRDGVESIAYTWAIRRDGQLMLCNDLDRAVWSQGYKGRKGDENAEFMSVMFEGMFHGPGVTDRSAGEPNAQQLLSGLMLWQACRQTWKWADDDLHGHFQFGKPACPGATLQTVIEAVRVNAPKHDYDLDTSEGRQRALKDLKSYTGEVDGVWGPASRGALIRFQGKYGLAADGVWGPISEAMVMRALRDVDLLGQG